MFIRFMQGETNATMKVVAAKRRINQTHLYKVIDYLPLIEGLGPSEETYGPINKWAFPLNKARQPLYIT